MLNLNLNLGAPQDSTPKETMAPVSPDPELIYDLIVIGGGPAGLNAALYAKRKGRDVAVIGEALGGQMLDTSTVENYIGTDGNTGSSLSESFARNIRNLEVPVLEYYFVDSWEQGDDGIFTLTAGNGQSYQARTLIVATGSSPRHLNVPGEEQLANRGLSYCAICDGPLFRNKRHVIVGGGNSAVEAAIDMARIASEVEIVQRSTFRADQILMDELNSYPNVTTHTQTDIVSIEGEEKVSGVTVHNKETDETHTIPTDAVFIEIGHIPNLGPFEGDLDVNGSGEIIVDMQNQTNIPGIFAAGDVTDTPYKQIIIAAAEGAKAALSANNYLTINAKKQREDQRVRVSKN